ncbi:hemin uptake protein HemP [Coralliovum pocilloporae]|uniref:hemin uptake protein HemP n=1 Tax=Coralliovum pocilloporae TaxID=3066369 RepID=UPI0033078D12
MTVEASDRPVLPEKGDVTQPHYTSDEIFHGRKIVLISHGDTTYRLQITSQQKLILTK